MPWSTPTTNDEAARRAGGRRRYNAQRQIAAFQRRQRLIHLLQPIGLTHGAQRRLAHLLHVSPSTISRDLALLDAIAPNFKASLYFGADPDGCAMLDELACQVDKT